MRDGRREFAFAVHPRVWCSRGVSDWLVQIQDKLAPYPSWMVAGAIGFVIVIAIIVVWKALRIALVALIVGVVIAGSWYVWENVRGRRQAPAPTLNTPAESGTL